MKPGGSFYLLGKYLTLISLLPAGAVAGYLIGSVATHEWHNPVFQAIGIVVGVAVSLVKVVQELLRDDGKGKP